MTREDVIEKIKKLLRMKRGGTPGEIENALAAAARLAREHGIDLAGVNPEESPSEKITHVDEALKMRLPGETKFAAAILVNFFNVQIVFTPAIKTWLFKRPAKMTLVGTLWDCQIARYVFVFLQRHFRYSWNHRSNRRLKNRQAFMHGMFLGLSAKLEKQQPQTEGLILATTARKDYLAKLYPNIRSSNLGTDKSSAWSSKLAGIKAGQDMEIRSGLDHAAAPKRPALPPSTPSTRSTASTQLPLL